MEEIKGTAMGLANGTGMNPWIYSSCVFAVIVSVGLVLRKLLWGRLAKWAKTTAVSWDEELLDAVKMPITFLIVILSFGIAGQSTPPIVRTHPLMIHGVKVFMIFCVVWILERALSVLLRSSLLPEALTAPTRQLFITIARVLLFVLGILTIMDAVGVPITPLLASLGIGSLAVGLALQDTLSNFFGGLYILVDRPIRLGDLIKVEDVEGQVERIGWRSTRIRLGSNDTVTLPNNKLASAQLKNYDMPNSYSALGINCGVAYGSDLERVQQVAIEVATEVCARVPGADPNFTPVVIFKEFGASSIDFSTVVQVTRFTSFGLVKSEFIKALHARFMREGIEIPFPQQVIHWNPGTAPQT